MSHLSLIKALSPGERVTPSRWTLSKLSLITLLVLVPLAAYAQGSPFDTGFNAIQSLFTGTIAKVASLVAIVIGGYDSPTRIGSVKEGRPANGRPLPGRPSLLQPGPGSG